MYGSLLHVPRRSRRLSGTIADSLGISYMCSYGRDTVADCLVVSCRCPSGLRDYLSTSQTVWGLLHVPRRSWHRRTLSGSLPQEPRRFKRLSGTVEDCLRVYSRCPDGHGIVADCLGVSCRYPDSFGTVADCLEVFCWCSAGLGDYLAPFQTVCESSSGVQKVLAPSQTVWNLL
ncbi:hypothetical protein DPMN_128550 [Dreissena polymorpha]|uniref:Uncharacterized protein n=1 Tax=Dreissena polymorpha TaxID=45954 RepID=A0A9D4JWJ4_DREPO|nr:hypothetical protein DPMN_128550 [Dreissena polymorpha]